MFMRTSKSLPLAIATFFCCVAIAIAFPADSQTPGAASSLEVAYEFGPANPPGNLTVTPDGRIIMSHHQFYGSPLRVVEVLDDGSAVPFPNEAWSTAPIDGQVGLNNVLGLRSDRSGVVWLLDRAPQSGFTGELVGWDTRGDRLHRVIYLGRPAIAESPFLNDLAIDEERNAIYITDTASGSDSALIVVDLDTGLVQRVLEGHESVRPEQIPMVIDGRTIMLGDEPAYIGANPIAIDPQNEWVYYGPMSGRSLYRIRAEDLGDRSLSAAALAARVERYGDKPICDGIIADRAGNVYVTDITHDAIGVVTPDGSYRRLFQDANLLSWTDAMSFGPDGYIYVAVNQLHRSPPLNGGQDGSRPPFAIVRFRPLASGS